VAISSTEMLVTICRLQDSQQTKFQQVTFKRYVLNCCYLNVLCKETCCEQLWTVRHLYFIAGVINDELRGNMVTGDSKA